MMRTIERTTHFRRDLRRVLKGAQGRLFPAALDAVLDDLMSDRPLSLLRRDHALVGGWSGYRDSHLAPDLVLIYRKVEADRLLLVRLGSHSELGLG